MMNSSEVDELAAARSERGYWDAHWRIADVPDPVDASSTKPEDRLYRLLHRDFLELFSPRPQRLVEVGCGGSRFLPYFARTFGIEVSGLDYSNVGCDLARAILAKAGVRGTIVKGDMFDPPPELIRAFDVVASFGLVEHFEDTSKAIAACARLLRPGGVMVTLIPNFAGLYGWLYRFINPAIYEIHVPLTRKQLIAAHVGAGMDIIRCRFLLGFPGVMDVEGRSHAANASAKRRIAARVGRMIWRMEEAGLSIPPNQITSPYIVCYARAA